MYSLAPSPREQQLDHRESARAQREARRIAVDQMQEVDIPASERDLAFVHDEHRAKRSPDGVLEIRAKQHQAGGAEPIVLIASEHVVAPEIRSAQRRLEVEGHHVTARYDGLLNQQ